MDMAEHNANRREMEANLENGIAAPPPAYTSEGKPQPPRGYVPPVTPY